MPIYEIKGYIQSTTIDKVRFKVEATSEEEAMILVKDDPNDYYEDSKCIDVVSNEYIYFNDWEIIGEKNARST